MINIRDLAKAEMRKTSDIILGFPWHDPLAYAMWLAQTFYMVNHSTRLVALAGAYCELDQNDLHARFVDHSQEERGHQKVAISDINVLGYKLEDLPQVYQSAAMYQIQYYWIQHRGPISFFGYTLALESLAGEFGPQLYKMTSEAHTAKAAKFLKLHSDDDVEHLKAAYEQIEKLDQKQAALVKENLELSSAIYRAMLQEVQELRGRVKIERAS